MDSFQADRSDCYIVDSRLEKHKDSKQPKQNRKDRSGNEWEAPLVEICPEGYPIVHHPTHASDVTSGKEIYSIFIKYSLPVH